jgi:DNA-binding NarL/FixJ family response regulator
LKNTLNCLIVDDHPMLIDGYITVISNFVDNYDFNFIIAIDCESGYKVIEQNHNINNNIDVAIFDISLPAYKKKTFYVVVI